jgi:hypothetical protein
VVVRLPEGTSVVVHIHDEDRDVDVTATAAQLAKSGLDRAGDGTDAVRAETGAVEVGVVQVVGAPPRVSVVDMGAGSSKDITLSVFLTLVRSGLAAWLTEGVADDLTVSDPVPDAPPPDLERPT